MTDKPDTFESIIAEYLSQLANEFESAKTETYNKPYLKRTKQLLLALLAEQVTIVTLLGNNTHSLSTTSAPMFLRVILEAAIKVAWLILSPDENTLLLMKSDLRSFEQTSLEMQSFAEANNEQVQSAIDAANDWLNSEQAEINFRDGKVKDLDIRDLAKRAGDETMRIYRTFYVLLSGNLHSTWSQVSRYNLIRSANPLHRAAFVPTIKMPDRDVVFILIAAEIIDHSMKALTSSEPRAFSWLLGRLTVPKI